jgi:hypothetical protein
MADNVSHIEGGVFVSTATKMFVRKVSTLMSMVASMGSVPDKKWSAGMAVELGKNAVCT